MPYYGAWAYSLLWPFSFSEQIFAIYWFLINYLYRFVLSLNSQVNWRAVLWGLGLQFALAIFILRTDLGFDIFEWIGNRVTHFLEHSDAGAEFVFGEVFREHFFAFSVSSCFDKYIRSRLPKRKYRYGINLLHVTFRFA